MTFKNFKHGGKGTRLYHIWKSMRQRCNNPKAQRHNVYYDKGIRICKEWDDFSAFREWALKNGYSDTLTIDRINPNGNYEPSNCRWATQKEQQNNRSNTIHVTIGSETKTLSEWSEKVGVKRQTLWARYHKGIRGEELIKPAITLGAKT